MHSGPVTGGFLKGKSARFQLFGDTMTTAHLVLAHTLGETIQMSETTANLLKQAGKTTWVVEREDKIETLEKGIINTFYLSKGSSHRLRQLGISTCDSSSNCDSIDPYTNDLAVPESEQRWIEWNTNVFENLLRHIVARRTLNIALGNVDFGNVDMGNLGTSIANINLTLPTELNILNLNGSSSRRGSSSIRRATIPLEEVKTIIELPEFDKRAARRQRDNKDVEIPEAVVQQLRNFVTEIAEMYK